MKRIAFHCLRTLLVGALLATPAFAEDAEKKKTEAPRKEISIPVKLAIIDMQTIFQKAKVFQDIHRQVEVHRKTFHEEIAKEEETLRQAKQELTRKGTVLEANVLREEREKFEKMWAQTQQSVQYRSRSLQKVFVEAEKKARKAVRKAVGEVAMEHKLTLVIKREAVVIWPDVLDITKEVIKKLDKAMPSIKVAKPVIEKPAGGGREAGSGR